MMMMGCIDPEGCNEVFERVISLLTFSQNADQNF